MCCNSSCTGQKSNEIKVNANLFFTLSSKLSILIIDHEESCFFLPLLNPLLHCCNLLKIFNWPYTSQKQPAQAKTYFSFQTKHQIIPFKLAGKVNILTLFKLDSKTLLVCHIAVASTKWKNLKATQTNFSTNCNTTQQKSFLKSHFSNFVIKQYGNSRKLRWVNSTKLNNKICLILIS